jgi:hypothetical protein
MSVRWSGKMLSVAVLMVTVAAPALHAAPTVAMKAADCCAGHCQHRSHPVRPDGCCHVRSHAADAALPSVTPRLDHPAVSFVALRHASCSDVAFTFVGERSVHLPRSGPPLFLAIRSLRL